MNNVIETASKMNKYNVVLVYTGYCENSVESVETFEAQNINEVLNVLLERDREQHHEFEDQFDEFFGDGKVINDVGVSMCGEENIWVVLPEGHKFYDTVLISTDKWSNEQWNEWIEFVDEETFE
jgi:hypothetical protein